MSHGKQRLRSLAVKKPRLGGSQSNSGQTHQNAQNVATHVGMHVSLRSTRLGYICTYGVKPGMVIVLPPP